MASDRIILITGANRGIGYELAKRLSLHSTPCHILMGCRDESMGEQAAKSLNEHNLSVTYLQLDVTDDISIANAVEFVKTTFGRLDALVNNAGIANDSRLEESAASVREVYRDQFDTNLFGAAQVTEAFLGLLERSPGGACLVFTSSRLGSLAQRQDANDRYYSSMLPVYRTSKAALNMLCLHYATLYKDAGWRVNAVDPGHVATGLNNFCGPDTVEDGAVQLAKMAMLGPGGTTGTFSNKEGPVPW
ncbi:carbonyl reductase [Xylariomycetidae sp. FL2044]|nr:carbonyl reductase [Xylariomycetidae sp. FL2044]